MRKFIHIIDATSERTAKIGRWFAVILMVLVTGEVTMRYVFNAPTLWGYEVHVMLAASLYILAFAYTHLHRAHVRVDMIYAHLPPRGRAAIDVLGTLLLFFPFIFLLTASAWDWQYYAWESAERMPITGWYPPAGPLRTVVFYGIALFALQVVAHFIRDVYLLFRGRPYD
jgi:TRAP-type mannitol/chloroaromatic compound transport system permease small subunit